MTNRGGGDGSDRTDGTPPPPAGYVEEPAEQEGAQVLAEAEAGLDRRWEQTEHVKDAERRWIPGDRALDNNYEGYIAKKQAQVPAEEAEEAARAAGAMAAAVDDDARAVAQDAARLAATQPGSPQARAAREAADELQRVEADAVAEGLAVSQDALNAERALKTRDVAATQAAEDAAQADQGRVARDLAQADAARAKVEGRPVDDKAGLPPDPD